MTKSITFLGVLLFLTAGFSQEDDKAKGILDKVSTKMDKLESISVSFTTIIYGDGDPIKQTGEAHLKGDKYKIELDDQDIYCDGKKIVTHLKDGSKEAYVSRVEDAQEGTIRPNEMLTIWETGHKYRYYKETTYKDRAVHQIHLYPKNPGEKKYHTIILKIDQEKNEVMSVYIKGNDGTNMKYVLTEMKENPDLPDSMFTFDKAKHPDVDLIEE